jgi:hypothetical protein
MSKFSFSSLRRTIFFQSDFSFFGPVYHRTGPVYRSNRSVYRSGPIVLRNLNSNLHSPGFRPVPDRTGPVNRYRTSPVRFGPVGRFGEPCSGLPVGRVQVARLRAQVLLQEAVLATPGKRYLARPRPRPLSHRVRVPS